MGEKKEILKKIDSIKEAIEEHITRLKSELEKKEIIYSYDYFKEILTNIPEFYSLFPGSTTFPAISNSIFEVINFFKISFKSSIFTLICF